MTLFKSRLHSYLVLNYVPRLIRNNPLVAIPVTSPLNLEISVNGSLDNEIIENNNSNVSTTVKILAPIPNEVKHICEELIINFINRLLKEVGFTGNIKVLISSEVPQQLRSMYVVATNYLVNILSGELSEDIIHSMSIIDKLLGIDEATIALRYSIFCRNKPIIYRRGEGYICSQYEVYANIGSIKYVVYDERNNYTQLENIPKSISNALIHLTGAVGIELFKLLMKEQPDIPYARFLLRLINSLNYLAISDDVVNSVFAYLEGNEMLSVISKDIGNVIDVIKFNIAK